MIPKRTVKEEIDYVIDGAMDSWEWGKIPDHMHNPLRNYIKHGIPGGGFMNSVLTNDLRGAVTRADAQNKDALLDWVYFLLEFPPHTCWGSHATVQAWIDHGGWFGYEEQARNAAVSDQARDYFDKISSPNKD